MCTELFLCFHELGAIFPYSCLPQVSRNSLGHESPWISVSSYTYMGCFSKWQLTFLAEIWVIKFSIIFFFAHGSSARFFSRDAISSKMMDFQAFSLKMPLVSHEQNWAVIKLQRLSWGIMINWSAHWLLMLIRMEWMTLCQGCTAHSALFINSANDELIFWN